MNKSLEAKRLTVFRANNKNKKRKPGTEGSYRGAEGETETLTKGSGLSSQNTREPLNR